MHSDHALRNVSLAVICACLLTPQALAQATAEDDPFARLDAISQSMDPSEAVAEFEKTLERDRAAAQSMAGAVRRLHQESDQPRMYGGGPMDDAVGMMATMAAITNMGGGGHGGGTAAGVKDMAAALLDALGSFNDPADAKRQARRLQIEFERVLLTLQSEQESLARIAQRTYESIDRIHASFQALDESDLDGFYVSTTARAGLCSMALDIVGADPTAGLADRVEVILENRRSLATESNWGLESCLRRDVSLPALQFERLLAGLSSVRSQQREQLTRLGAAFGAQMQRVDQVLARAEVELFSLESSHLDAQRHLELCLGTYRELTRRIAIDIGTTSAAAALRMSNIANSPGHGHDALMNATRGMAATQDMMEIAGDLDSLQLLREIVETNEDEIIAAMDLNTRLLGSIAQDLETIRTSVDQRWLETTVAVRSFVGDREAEQMNWRLPHEQAVPDAGMPSSSEEL